MEQKNRPVEMISICSTEGRILPVRFRFEAEDRSIRTVSISEVVSTKEISYVGIEAILYFCKAQMEELERLKSRFLGLTEGMTFTELDAMRRLSKREAANIRDLCAVVDLYKYGVKENPWQTLSAASLKTAKDDFRKRIKGQDTALERTLDVVKRAVTGMNGLSSSSTGKPKGVLFFAGPTGTGKTETAKALA